jgi:hypothetical protein
MDFQPECRIERWRRSPAPAPAAPSASRLVWDPAADRDAFGADRSALLSDLARYTGASFNGAWAFARPGASAAFFGPCVAAEADDADLLFRWFVAHHADQPAVVDLFPHHTAATATAAGLGFVPFRRLMRMVRRPVRPRLPDPRIFAIAGFEWG